MSGPSASAGARLERSRRRVLVVDDSSTYRAVAARLLGDAGYAVVEVADGAEALARLATVGGEVDVLVLDLDLPGAMGLDLLRRVRESPRLARLPVLALAEAVSEHRRRVLGDLRLDALLRRGHALCELLWQVDALAFPQQSEVRQSPRRLARIPVNYWVGEQLHLESCFDLSLDGMFVSVADHDPPPVGSLVPLRFWLPTGERLIGVEGRVVWINSASGDLRLSHPPGMGVSFTRLDEADRKLLRDYLERVGP